MEIIKVFFPFFIWIEDQAHMTIAYERQYLLTFSYIL